MSLWNTLKKVITIVVVVCFAFVFFYNVAFAADSSLVGRWYLREGQDTRNNPENMELLKDGTGIVDGTGITWKTENGRFYIFHPLKALARNYVVDASGTGTLLLVDNGKGSR